MTPKFEVPTPPTDACFRRQPLASLKTSEGTGPGIRGSTATYEANGCARKVFLRAVAKQRWKPSIYQAIGSWVHLTIAHHAENQLENPQPWAKRPIEDLRQSFMGSFTPQQQEEVARRAEPCAQYAIKTWARFGIPNLVATETQVITTLGQLDPGGPRPDLDNEVVSATFDGIVLDPNSGRWDFEDHKTESGYVQKKSRVAVPQQQQGWAPNASASKPAYALSTWDPKSRFSGKSIEYELKWQQVLYKAIAQAAFGKDRVGKMWIRRILTNEPYAVERYPLPINDFDTKDASRLARLAVIKEMDVLDRWNDHSEIPIREGLGYAGGCQDGRWGYQGTCEFLPQCAERIIPMKNLLRK